MGKIIAIAVAVVWLVIDYQSKQWALATLSQQMIVVNDYMNYVLAFNPGAAFSFMADAGGTQRWFFAALALVVSVWLVYSILKDDLNMVPRLAYGSVLGGALGNMIDRLALLDGRAFALKWGHIDNPKPGQVIDFIQWHYGEVFYWPVFNVADVAITVGVILLLFHWLSSLFLSGKRWGY